MSARFELTALCAALACGGCSLIVGELHLSCEEQSDCDALNAKHEIDPRKDCIVYQCRSDRRGCEKRPRDRDGDGYPDHLTCADAGLPPDVSLDCDDTREARAPDGQEICDGLDNDCDTFIDEGALDTDSLALATSATLGVPDVEALSHALVGNQLLVAVTGALQGAQRTVLHVIPEGRSVHLQSEITSERNCDTKLKHCVLGDVTIAASDELLVAIGVESRGEDVGRVRVASRGAWAAGEQPPLTWDGAEARPSNLAQGIDTAAACTAVPAMMTATSPRLALTATHDGPVNGLALWRTAPPGVRAPLVGIGLLGPTNHGAGIEASEEPCSHVLSGMAERELGFDPASIEVWDRGATSGYFVGYDSGRGAELAFVSQVERGGRSAFSRAKATRIEMANVRHVAIALAQEPRSGETSRVVGLALQAQGQDGSTIHFARLSFHSGSDEAFVLQAGPFNLASGVDLLEGPFLAYMPDGFRDPANGAPRGGWFVLWIEGGAGTNRLMAQRVHEVGTKAEESAFAVFEGTALSHAFVYATAEGGPAYGLVNDDGQLTLNIGSIKCRPPR